jgi:glucose-6-phosphate dehydrogenase assembly protein OpcA
MDGNGTVPEGVMAQSATGVPMRFTHVSGLNAVERTLDSFHREVLRSGDDDGAVRLAVANIVAACTTAADAEHAVDVLCALGERHPSRVIVILANPQRDPVIEADISFRCLPDTQRICTELVRLVVEGEPALHLASIVTPLLMPDIGVYLWLLGAPRLAQAFHSDTVAMCERIVLDSARYDDTVATLALIADELRRHGDQLSLGDIAWERSRVWRETSAQAFDSRDMRRLLFHITDVEITTAGAKPSSQAWLTAGWLASRLAWTSEHTPALRLLATEAAAVDDADLVAIRFRCSDGKSRAEVTLERNAHTLSVLTQKDGEHSGERIIELRQLEDTDVVGALMAESGDDPIYDHAATHAVELAARQ